RPTVSSWSPRCAAHRIPLVVLPHARKVVAERPAQRDDAAFTLILRAVVAAVARRWRVQRALLGEACLTMTLGDSALRLCDRANLLSERAKTGWRPRLRRSLLRSRAPH